MIYRLDPILRGKRGHPVGSRPKARSSLIAIVVAAIILISTRPPHAAPLHHLRRTVPLPAAPPDDPGLGQETFGIARVDRLGPVSIQPVGSSRSRSPPFADT